MDLLSSTRYRWYLLLAAVAALIVSSPHPSWAASKPRKQVTKKAAAKNDPEAVASSFQVLCDEWMQKLQVREHDNIEHLKWEHDADGVQGTYVGYSQEHTCKLVEGSEADPVGKISYREVHYNKRGSTVDEAEHNPPQPVEIYDVQEIFHYLKGKWDL